MSITNLYEVLYKPRETITANLQSYNVWIPILFIGIISSILNAIYGFLFYDDIHIMENSLLSITSIFLIFSFIIGLIAPVFGILLNSIINYITILITGVYVEFKSLIVIGVLSYVPVIIELFLKVIITFITGNYNDYILYTSLAGFFRQNSMLQSLFSSLSITGFWSLLIYMLGVVLLMQNQQGKVKKLTVVFVFIVNIALSIAMAVFKVMSNII